MLHEASYKGWGKEGSLGREELGDRSCPLPKNFLSFFWRGPSYNPQKVSVASADGRLK